MCQVHASLWNKELDNDRWSQHCSNSSLQTGCRPKFFRAKDKQIIVNDDGQQQPAFSLDEAWSWVWAIGVAIHAQH